MRITDKQKEIFIQSAKDVFQDRLVEVRLFGSRAIDTKKGGDFDLYFEVSNKDIDDKRLLQYNIIKSLGYEICLDIVIGDKNDVSLIYKNGRKGVLLW